MGLGKNTGVPGIMSHLKAKKKLEGGKNECLFRRSLLESATVPQGVLENPWGGNLDDGGTARVLSENSENML